MMKAMKKIGLIVIITVLPILAGGCYKHTYIVGKGATPRDQMVYGRWHLHFFYGLIGNRNVRVEDYCPSGNALVQEHITFVNGLIGNLTSGIFTPSTVVIFCKLGEPPPSIPPQYSVGPSTQ